MSPSQALPDGGREDEVEPLIRSGHFVVWRVTMIEAARQRYENRLIQTSFVIRTVAFCPVGT